METLSQRARREAETEDQHTERRETDAAFHQIRREVMQQVNAVIVAVNIQQDYQTF